MRVYKHKYHKDKRGKLRVIKYKHCSLCNTYKQFDDFDRSDATRDGRAKVCRECSAGEIIDIEGKHKWCNGCAQEKSLHDFWHNKNCKDGHDNYCIECRLVQKRKRRGSKKIKQTFKKRMEDVRGWMEQGHG